MESCTVCRAGRGGFGHFFYVGEVPINFHEGTKFCRECAMTARVQASRDIDGELQEPPMICPLCNYTILWERGEPGEECAVKKVSEMGIANSEIAEVHAFRPTLERFTVVLVKIQGPAEEYLRVVFDEFSGEERFEEDDRVGFIVPNDTTKC